MSERWEWPGPDAPVCGAQATDRKTGEHVYCNLAHGHSDHFHHWEEVVGDQLRSATWIADGLVTFIGKPNDD